MAEVKATKKDQEFVISAKFGVDLGLTIKATSLEDALAKSKTLKPGDFINFNKAGVSVHDYSVPEIYSIYKED